MFYFFYYFNKNLCFLYRLEQFKIIEFLKRDKNYKGDCEMLTKKELKEIKECLDKIHERKMNAILNKLETSSKSSNKKN